ncbi:tetratricopeptide repeat protein [Dinoroseobacter sp. S76]|uniref:tetratricopeptide repeat protein n=1 Tax=Dinoroseobacter sp. S76 TaxID=3415124 RepID=UPI003C7C2EE1
MDAFLSSIAENWNWAWKIALTFGGGTAFAVRVMSVDAKKRLFLWLAGAEPGGWPRQFNTLFDGVFGDDHRSWRCIKRSAIASLLFVVLIWLLMSRAGLFETRAQAVLAFPTLLATGIVVNVVADYISLLETRWLLGQMETRWTHPLAQVGVLLLDLLLTGAIIFGALWLYSQSPLHSGSAFGLAELLTAFSVYAVFFYSTFLTSFWVWAFVLSTLAIKAMVGLNLPRRTDLKGYPGEVIGGITGLAVLLGALTAAAANQNDDAVTLGDRVVCVLLPGEICYVMAELTDDEQLQLFLLEQACESGLTEECYARGRDILEIDGKTAERLLAASCRGGNARGCTSLGFVYERALDVASDPEKAAELYAEGCEGGDARGCTNLGFLYSEGLGVQSDPIQSERYYTYGCDRGDAKGCWNLGVVLWLGQRTSIDKARALELMISACEMGLETSCDWLRANPG